MMEFLDIPVFDDDFYKMIFRFSVNIFFLTIIIYLLHYKNNKKKDYIFTYYLISSIVFFLCFTLKKYELDIGMALGLFAIFGIIRYRTDAMPIKEMTYLFIVIGVSVINSLANKKMSYSEIFTANIIIVMLIYFVEKLIKTEQEVITIITKEIIYEKIENIKPCNYEILKIDLEERLGLVIDEVEIKNVDFIKNAAKLRIHYNTNKQLKHYEKQ